MGQTKSSNNGGIDENLRRVFQSTLDEEIPDRFKDLLKQLQEQPTSAQASSPEANE